ncbi:M12 family metallopeptidase [Dyadobacter arcticus]|uniref:Peptidase M12A domain-containing protein n=1 Tax=Dyadobacter arcticus TaxID=1078754 RepID=A0ABX0UP89_9BACT|nr:M12 family metallopeptidase [Dyadobacter arcticus]NIJ52851.1 hypothetical protein [Dyadobacter arcticus]
MNGIYFLARTSVFLLSIAYMTSCREMEQENEIVTASASTSTRTKPEEAYPGEEGVLKKGTLFRKEITYTEIDNKAVFQGDIILTPEQLNATKNARVEGAGSRLENTRWERGIVFYTINTSTNGKEIVQAAIAEVEASTPIRFIQRTNQSDYVTFSQGRGLSSSLGRTGGQQFIMLPILFTKGGVLHEIGHALGLLHEHTRESQASTLNINPANAYDSMLPSLKTYSSQYYAGFDLGSMDFESIMMMDSYAYSKNGLPVMTRKDGSTFGVQRDHFSAGDISCITVMYSNLLAISADKLYAADLIKGKKTFYPSYWAGSEAVISTPLVAYVALGGQLFWLDPLTGEAHSLASNFSGVKGMVYLEGYLYVLQNGYLWKVNAKSGYAMKVGGQIWKTATAITYASGFFFIVSGDNLFRVTLGTQTFVSLGTGYTGVTEITSLKDLVYVIKASKLYKVNPITSGVSVYGISTWSSSARLTASKDILLLVDQGVLYNVDAIACRNFISNGWSGINKIAATIPETW